MKMDEPKQEYIEDDVQLIMEVQQQQEQRFPVIDPTRPFVCQKCGVSFAREKALLSHSKVKKNFVFPGTRFELVTFSFTPQDAWR